MQQQGARQWLAAVQEEPAAAAPDQGRGAGCTAGAPGSGDWRGRPRPTSAPQRGAADGQGGWPGQQQATAAAANSCCCPGEPQHAEHLHTATGAAAAAAAAAGTAAPPRAALQHPAVAPVPLGQGPLWGTTAPPRRMQHSTSNGALYTGLGQAVAWLGRGRASRAGQCTLLHRASRAGAGLGRGRPGQGQQGWGRARLPGCCCRCCCCCQLLLLLLQLQIAASWAAVAGIQSATVHAALF
jgi:hypothetical protein